MERLTYYVSDGKQLIAAANCDGIEYRGYLVERLADYENTGFSPEEINRIQETLVTVQRLKKEQYDTLEKYLKAEAEGRLVILPCKAGTPLWRVFNGAVEKYFVVSVTSKTHINRRTLIECMPFMRFYWEDEVDKTIFLTKEEAESALKGAANAD